MLEDRLMIALTSAGAGALTSLSFYLKMRTNEKFHWEKMMRTVLLAGTVGFIAGYRGVEKDVIVNSGAYGLITVIVENVVKLTIRKVVPWVKSIFG